MTEQTVNEMAATPAEQTLPDDATTPTTEATVDELAQTRQALTAAQAKADEYLDGWQRARAEMANYRRRTEAERATLTTTANARLLTRLLPVLDDLERAFETLPPDLRNLTWIQGVSLVYRKLQTLFEGEGATPIDAVGRPFDPKVHDAIMQESSAEYPEGTVISELQRGYMYGDQLLRPALVKVSSGPGPQVETRASDDEGK